MPKMKTHKGAQKRFKTNGAGKLMQPHAMKSHFRRLWIQRINAGARLNGMSYSVFINGLTKAGVEVDRKVLADLAVAEPEAFAALVVTATQALDDDAVATPASA